MPSTAARFACLLLVAAGWLAGGCQSLEDPVPCGQIPAGGCPAGRGGTCDDAACHALYDCAEGTWVVASFCSATGAGGAGGAGGSGGAGGAGGACVPVELDHTGETMGCSPPLQQPDCPAAAAEQCAESACLTDCSDFYMCLQDGNDKLWTVVAWCDESGQLTVGGDR